MNFTNFLGLLALTALIFMLLIWIVLFAFVIVKVLAAGVVANIHLRLV
jgi:hypothetical protein